MKKPLFLTALFTLLIIVSNAQLILSSYSDNSLNKLSKELFGFSLFQKSLPRTLDSLTVSNDFLPDTLIKHTDTSLFYFRGYWKNFNPFNEKMDSVKLIIAEKKRNYSVNGKVFTDSIFLFQIEGSLVNVSTDAIPHSTFKKLDKKVSPYFSKVQYGRNYKQRVWNAEWYRYYLPNSLEWTANITWAKRSSTWTTITLTFVTKLSDALVL